MLESGSPPGSWAQCPPGPPGARRPCRSRPTGCRRRPHPAAPPAARRRPRAGSGRASRAPPPAPWPGPGVDETLDCVYRTSRLNGAVLKLDGWVREHLRGRKCNQTDRVDNQVCAAESRLLLTLVGRLAEGSVRGSQSNSVTGPVAGSPAPRSSQTGRRTPVAGRRRRRLPPSAPRAASAGWPALHATGFKLQHQEHQGVVRKTGAAQWQPCMLSAGTTSLPVLCSVVWARSLPSVRLDVPYSCRKPHRLCCSACRPRPPARLRSQPAHGSTPAHNRSCHGLWSLFQLLCRREARHWQVVVLPQIRVMFLRLDQSHIQSTQLCAAGACLAILT